MNVPKRIAAALINSLKGGVVPRVGLPYIAVGRELEIGALLRDVDIVADGGASFRFIMGKYGSGKSVLLQTIRNHAMDRNFVVVDADLSPERRLHGSKGQGLATYKELVRNMSTKTKPEGGALTLILDRWISAVQNETAAGGVSPDDPAFAGLVEKRIHGAIETIAEMVHGFDFARLLTMYYRSRINGDDETKDRVVKWFRGEYASKVEARAELGVNIVIGDDDWYEYLKLFAAFLKKAGYSGLLILIDELVNIHKIPNSIARQYNYEKILAMYNDALQGKASHLGVIMCGTPQCIEDPRRGVFSYEALRSRLEDGRFGREGMWDMLAPVIRLSPLTYEEMLVLIEKLAAIHAGLFEYRENLAQDDLINFIKIEFSRIGADKNITPREVIRDFIEALNILFQNPDMHMPALLADRAFAFAKPEAESGAVEKGFEEFEV
jgi:hypothetical protein